MAKVPKWFLHWYNRWWVDHAQYTGTRVERERSVAYTAYLKGKKDAKKWVPPNHHKKTNRKY